MREAIHRFHNPEQDQAIGVSLACAVSVEGPLRRSKRQQLRSFHTLSKIQREARGMLIASAASLHQWQEANGPLIQGQRLLPKTPFVLGGKFELENLYSLDAVSGMCFRGELANQLLDLPDGTEVNFKIVP